MTPAIILPLRAHSRLWRLAAGAVVLGLLLGACGAKGDTPASAITAAPTRTGNTPAPGTAAPASGAIRFVAPGGPAQLEAYTRLAEQFQQDQPGQSVSVEVVPGADDYRERLRADFAAGSLADVMVISYLDLQGLMARGLFTPVAPMLETSTVITETDFYPQVVSPFRWKRRLACLPQAASGLVVYYNRDLFAQAGVAEPPPDWDWERFTATAQALTRDLDGDGRTDQFGLGLEPGLVSLAPFVWQNQGDLVESPGWPTRFVLNRPPGLKAVEWYADLQVKLHAVPDAEAEAAEPSLDRFTAGSMGMYLGSRAAVAGLRQAARFDWDVAPLPANHGRRSNVLLADGYCLSSTSDNPQAAWRFVEYAASARGQAVLAASGLGVPALRSAAESAAFLDPSARPAHSQVFVDALRDASPLPIAENWPDIELIVDDEIQQAFYGRVPAADAMQAAMLRADEYFKIHVTP